MSRNVTPMVRAWLHDSAASVPDPVAIYAEVDAAIRSTPIRREPQVRLRRQSARSVLGATSLVVMLLVIIGAAAILGESGAEGPQRQPAEVAALPAAAPAEASPGVSVTIAPALPSPTHPATALDAPDEGRGWDARVDLEAALALPGQTLTATASLCLDGACRPARNPRWTVNSAKYGDLIRPQRGPQVRVTAKPRIGAMEIRAKGIWGTVEDGAALAALGVASLEVRPRPGDASLQWRRRHGGDSWVFPDVQVLRIGQHVALTGWRCPAGSGQGYGADGRPGTADDDCLVSPISSAQPLPGSGMTVLGIYGPSVLLRVDSFVEMGGALNPVGVGVRYDVASALRSLALSGRLWQEIPYLYVRNEPWRGPRLGDVDRDGDVDVDDHTALADLVSLGSVPPTAPGWQAAMDVNADRIIDETDLQLVDALTASVRPGTPGYSPAGG